MGELIVQLIEGMTNAELIATLGAFLIAIQAVIRALGEFFLEVGKFGKLSEKEDFFDSAGAVLRSLATTIGSGLAWFGIGNKK